MTAQFSLLALLFAPKKPSKYYTHRPFASDAVFQKGNLFAQAFSFRSGQRNLAQEIVTVSRFDFAEALFIFCHGILRLVGEVPLSHLQDRVKKLLVFNYMLNSRQQPGGANPMTRSRSGGQFLQRCLPAYSLGFGDGAIPRVLGRRRSAGSGVMSGPQGQFSCRKGHFWRICLQRESMGLAPKSRASSTSPQVDSCEGGWVALSSSHAIPSGIHGHVSSCGFSVEVAA